MLSWKGLSLFFMPLCSRPPRFFPQQIHEICYLVSSYVFPCWSFVSRLRRSSAFFFFLFLADPRLFFSDRGSVGGYRSLKSAAISFFLLIRSGFCPLFFSPFLWRTTSFPSSFCVRCGVPLACRPGITAPFFSRSSGRGVDFSRPHPAPSIFLFFLHPT